MKKLQKMDICIQFNEVTHLININFDTHISLQLCEILRNGFNEEIGRLHLKKRWMLAVKKIIFPVLIVTQIIMA